MIVSAKDDVRADTETHVSKATLVVNCGQLLTLAGVDGPRSGADLQELGILHDASLYVENGRIVAAGEYRQLRNKVASDAETIDAQGRAVLPGFVDAHTHPIFGGNRIADFEQRIAGRTYQEIAAGGGGISSTLKHTREATEEALIEVAERHANWFLRGGTTTIEAKSGYGLTYDSEIKSLQVLRALKKTSALRVVPTLLAAHIVPPEYRDDRAAYQALITEELIPFVAQHDLARNCDIFCDEHAFTVDEARAILTKAKVCGLGLRMHVEQFRADGGAKLAAELGAKTADHLECVEDDGIRAMKAAGVQPVLLPASVFALSRKEYPNVRAMIEAGLAPVVATDFNPGSSPTTSMSLILALSALYMRMLPAEAIVASTINAAASLDLAHEIGSLTPGKRADFVIHECEDYRELPYFLATPARLRVFVGGTEVQAWT